jgi:protein phosphatase
VDIRQVLNVDKFDGILTISDIHGEYQTAQRAVNIALEENLLVIFLGDLFDGGSQPLAVLQLVEHVIDQEQGIFIIGNHDDKFYRNALGNPVKLGVSQMQTVNDIPDMELFNSTLCRVIDHARSSLYAYCDQYLFAHAGVSPSLWQRPETATGKQKSMCLYGEVDGTRDEYGFPRRYYTWCNEVPAEHYAFVGHDRSAKGKSLDQIGEYINANGGKTYFTDCSCGKEPNNPVGVAIIKNNTVETRRIY